MGEVAGSGFVALPPLAVVVVGTAYFAALYFGMGGITWLLTRRVLPASRSGSAGATRRQTARTRATSSRASNGLAT